MSKLADSDSLEEWKAAYAGYDSTIQKHAKTAKRRAKLPDLDRFVRKDLPDLAQSRFSEETLYGYLLKDELCRIVEWKITRGKMRPLMRFANALTAEEVKSTTRQAFIAARDDPKEAMKSLTSLNGIGPATASAILSLASAEGSCPFLSDEVMLAFDFKNPKTGKLDYTIANWEKVQAKCAAKAEQLNKEEAQESEEGEGWTAAKVEQAIWAASDEKS